MAAALIISMWAAVRKPKYWWPLMAIGCSTCTICFFFGGSATMCQKEDQVVQVWQKLRLVLAFGLNQKNVCVFFKRILFFKVPKVVAWWIQMMKLETSWKPEATSTLWKPGADSTPNRHSSSGWVAKDEHQQILRSPVNSPLKPQQICHDFTRHLLSSKRCWNFNESCFVNTPQIGMSIKCSKCRGYTFSA